MKNTYTQRVSLFQADKNALKKQYTTLAWLRVSLFFVAIIFITISANAKITEGITITSVAFVVLFIYLFRKHLSVKTALSMKEALLKINEEEILRLDMKFSSLDGGTEFIKPTHEYHIDLDIFGKHSIFQLLNRTSTEFGKRTLANWLSTPANKTEVIARQEAVKEVSDLIDWRQDIQASGIAFKKEKASVLPLLEWVKTKNTILDQKFYHLAVIFVPILSLISIVATAIGLVPIGAPFLMIVVNMAILATTFQRANDIYKQTIESNKVLLSYQAQIGLIENQDFNSDLMKELKGRLNSKSDKASKVIKELQFILDNLHNRANLMYHIFNFLFILDVYWLIRAERWKKRTQEDIGAWFEAIGEIEA
ncbi:MAG: putative DNA-binding protein YlxM (UPF0122 family), partial [Roseivirga sp.]